MTVGKICAACGRGLAMEHFALRDDVCRECREEYDEWLREQQARRSDPPMFADDGGRPFLPEEESPC